MKMVIGVVDDESGSDAMALGAALVKTLPDSHPVLVSVHTTEYGYISRDHVDFEWEVYLAEQAEKTVAAGVKEMTAKYGITDCESDIHAHRSSGHGLAEYAHSHECGAIVIGSAPGGSVGRFQIGSTSNQLLHGAGVPVVLAPVGYRRRGVERIGRVVAAFAEGREGRVALGRGVELARECGVPLTIMTMLIRHRMYGAHLGAEAEQDALEGSLKSLRRDQESALKEIDTDGVQIEHEVTVGDNVNMAMNRMEWHADDLLVVPSSRTILRRVFLGDMAYKMVRSATVATMVLPRHTD